VSAGNADKLRPDLGPSPSNPSKVFAMNRHERRPQAVMARHNRFVAEYVHHLPEVGPEALGRARASAGLAARGRCSREIKPQSRQPGRA
jgi:hypothetical protein